MPTSSNHPLTVFIVEDNLIVRLALKMRLEKVPGIRLVGEAEDGQEAVDKVLKIKPQIVLMDVGLPSMNGIEACRQIKKSLPDTIVIMTTLHKEQETVDAATAAGADEYVHKESDDSKLIEAIQKKCLLNIARQINYKGRALAWLARASNGAFEFLDYLLADVEAKACTRAYGQLRGPTLSKSLKKQVELLLTHADTTIGDSDPHLSVKIACTQPHHAVSLTKLERVMQ